MPKKSIITPKDPIIFMLLTYSRIYLESISDTIECNELSGASLLVESLIFRYEEMTVDQYLLNELLVQLQYISYGLGMINGDLDDEGMYNRSLWKVELMFKALEDYISMKLF